MRVLSIGNSFSEDAQRYLNRLAKHNGEELLTVNLMIGGCSLETHYNKMISGENSYMLEVNGEVTGIWVNFMQVVGCGNWDVVTIQQASHDSFKWDTFYPYANKIIGCVRQCNPNAKIYVHETWAYEDGSERLREVAKLDTAKEMTSKIQECYRSMAKDICADGVIPSGTAMQKAADLGLKAHRDTFHASLGAGRYLIALCWYKRIFGKDISSDTFNEFDVPVSESEKEIVKKAVNYAFGE